MCVNDPPLTAIQLFPMAKTAGKYKHIYVQLEICFKVKMRHEIPVILNK